MTCRGTRKPHTWKVTGHFLFCLGCGRTLKLADLEPWRRAAIIRSTWRRLGRRAGDDLNRAIAEAQRRGQHGIERFNDGEALG